MNLDYNKLIFVHELKELSEEEVKELKKHTSREKNYIFGRQPYIEKDRKMFCDKVSQRLKSDHHIDKTLLEKAYIEANIIFPEEKELGFINLLLENGYSIQTLKNLLTIIEYLKDNSQDNVKNEQMHLSLEEQAQNRVNRITKIITKQYGYTKSETILNKIACILSFDTIDKIINQKIKSTAMKYRINKIHDLKLFYYTVIKESDKQLIDCNFIYETETINPKIIETVENFIDELKSETTNLNVLVEHNVIITDQLYVLLSENDKKTIDSITDCKLAFSESDEYQEIIDNVKTRKLTK